MIDINVTKFPIVILSNYRTGSSALAIKISKKYSLKCFSEPCHNDNITELDFHKMEFMRFYTQHFNNNFLIKFMPSQINCWNPYEEILSRNKFLIKLRRHNKIEQIASLYIANKRKKFFKLKTEKIEKYFLEINTFDLTQCCITVIRNDFFLEKLPYKEDMNLVYEDLGFISDTDHVLSDQPENMEEIKEEIRKILRWRWSSLKEHLVQSERFELSTPTTSR